MGYHPPHRDLKVPQSSRIVVDCRALSPSPTPCFVDFVRKKQLLTVFHSSPVTCTKKKNDAIASFLFYPRPEGLGMKSRFSVYGIAVGVWHHRRCIFGLDYIQCSALIPYRNKLRISYATKVAILSTVAP